MDNQKDILNDVYSSLINSLGVEPGLLSKSPIGRQLTEKFKNNNTNRDDGFIARAEALVYLQTNIPDNDMKETIRNEDNIKIETSSPFINTLTRMHTDEKIQNK